MRPRPLADFEFGRGVLLVEPDQVRRAPSFAEFLVLEPRGAACADRVIARLVAAAAATGWVNGNDAHRTRSLASEFTGKV